MIYFCVLLLVSSPWILSYIGFNINKKINSAIALSFCFFIFQFVLSPIYISFNLSFDNYKIIFWILFSLLFLTIFSLFWYFNFYKKKSYIEFLKEEWIKNTTISFSIFLTSIILLFVRVNFTDTVAYINLSTSFSNNQFPSFDGINSASLAYKIPTIYYSNAVFFQNNINAAYQYINPLIFFTLICSSMNEMNYHFLNVNKDKKQLIINILLNIALSFLFFATSYFSTSGNLFIQTAILFFYLSTLFITKNLFLSILSILMLTFFSSTGLLNVLLVILCTLLFSILFFNLKESLKLFLFSVLVLSPNISIISNNIYVYLISVFVSIFSLLILVFFERIFNNWKPSFVFINKKIIENKIFNYSFFIISILIALSILVFFGFFYKHKENYPSFTSILFFIFALIISAINFLKIKKNNYSVYELIFPILWISTIISTLFFYLIGLGDNLSLWRVIYLNFGMGSIIDIILIIQLILLINLNSFNFKKIKIDNIKRYTSILSISLFSISSISFAISLVTIKPEKLIFSSNIQKNLNSLSQNDIEYLKTIKSNQKINVLTDGPFIQYIKNSVCQSNLFFKTTTFENNQRLNSLTTTWYVSAYNFQGSIDFYNLNAKNKIDNNPIFLLDNFKLVLDKYLFNSNNNKIDIIILDNSTNYFSEFNNYLNTQNIELKYVGTDISVWGVNG